MARALARGGAVFGAMAIGWAVLVTAAVLLIGYQPRPSQLGSLLVRLVAQALFGEALLLLVWLAAVQVRSGPRGRGALLIAAATSLFGVYWRAYHVEPRALHVRHHQARLGSGDSGTIRVLHVTDLQTPAIGPHEERAFREGLAQRPDLIVLTGDYIQERVGRRTAETAARDLRDLLSRLKFQAPFGVFATEGDAGLSCTHVLPARQWSAWSMKVGASSCRGVASRARRSHARRAGGAAHPWRSVHRQPAPAPLCWRPPRLWWRSVARVARCRDGAGDGAPGPLPLSAGDLRPRLAVWALSS